jgi:hypothetical protein
MISLEDTKKVLESTVGGAATHERARMIRILGTIAKAIRTIGGGYLLTFASG